MFAASSLAPAGIAAAAAKAGVVTDGSADATANEALFQRELDNNLAIASQLQLNATPTWVVGNRLLQGQVGYDTLRQVIARSEEHTSELQSLMRISYAVFCLKKKNRHRTTLTQHISSREHTHRTSHLHTDPAN